MLALTVLSFHAAGNTFPSDKAALLDFKAGLHNDQVITVLAGPPGETNMISACPCQAKQGCVQWWCPPCQAIYMYMRLCFAGCVTLEAPVCLEDINCHGSHPSDMRSKPYCLMLSSCDS